MNISQPRPIFYSQLFAAIILLVMFDGFYINFQLAGIFRPIRYGIVIILGLGLLYFLFSMIKSGKLNKNQFLIVSTHLFLLAYGLFLGSIFGGLSLMQTGDYLFILLSVALTMLVIHEDNSLDWYKDSHLAHDSRYFQSYKKLNFNSFFLLLFIFSPFVLYISGAIQLSPIPFINFELTDQVGNVRNPKYSQNTTRLFAIGAILFAHLTFSNQAKLYSFLCLSFSMLMLLLSAISGARGDFIIGFLIVFLIVSRNLRLRNIILLAIFFGGVVGVVLSILGDNIGELTIVRRMISVIAGDSFGNRDILLGQSLELLSERTDCALIGCGFNFFQIHFGYDLGRYPHNIFAEILITFGFLIGIPIILFMALGVIFGFLSYFSHTLSFWIFLYFLGIHFKSGSLISITAIPVIIFFIYLGFRATVKYLFKKSI